MNIYTKWMKRTHAAKLSLVKRIQHYCRNKYLFSLFEEFKSMNYNGFLSSVELALDCKINRDVF